MACNISLVLPTNPKKMPALGYGTWQVSSTKFMRHVF